MSTAVSLRKGNKLVYPGHGVVNVLGRSNEPWINGTVKTMVVFQTTAEDNSVITLKVVADQVDGIGIRDVVDADTAAHVLKRIADTDVVVREPTNWSRRLKHNQERLKSPDIDDVTEVLCALAGRLRDTSHLSVAERRLMQQAEKMVVAEVAVALRRDEQDVLMEIRSSLA